MFWNADYSQLELRIFAFASKCQAMTQTFAEGGDIHATTTWRVFGVHPKDQTPQLRVRGKALNFGMSYGAQGETVEEQITVFALRNPQMHIPIPSLTECKDMVKAYWKAYPEAKEWVEFEHELIRDRGYAETFYGRRIYLPYIRHSNSELRARAQRQGVNGIVQGTAGDLIKMAAWTLWKYEIVTGNWACDIRAQIHDELMGEVFEKGHERQQEWLDVAQEYMLLDQPLMPVPLVVDPKLVKTWKEAK